MMFSPRFNRHVIVSLIIGTAAPAFGNVVGTDMQNFNPLTSGLDFVTVHSSEPLKPGVINLGLFFNYAVNTLPYFDSSPGGRMDFNDKVLGMDVNAGLGLTRNWDIGVSFPAILDQSVRDQNGARGEFEQTGGTEVKLNTKYRLMGDDSGGLAAIASVSINRTENNPWAGSGAGPTSNFELAADTTSGRVAYGANIGYRLRNPGAPIRGSRVQPLKDQVIASVAASYYMSDISTKVIGELFAGLPAANSSADGDRSLQSLEALAGLKHDVTGNLALHAGVGAGLIRGIASPDWRVYTGLNYTFGPLWDDNPNLERVNPPVAVYPPPRVQRFRTGKINFAFDSDQMIKNYDEVLSELVGHLKGGFNELIIEGHTDSIGTDDYNQKLSERRALAIQRYLAAKFHIDSRKITTVGVGETQPIADNGNYQGRQANRRVEFEVIR